MDKVHYAVKSERTHFQQQPVHPRDSEQNATSLMQVPPGPGKVSPLHQYIVTQKYGPEKHMTVCPGCDARVMTRVEYKVGQKTHCAALIMALLCGSCCCCVIPYCMNHFKVPVHYCPTCDFFLGTYNE